MGYTVGFKINRDHDNNGEKVYDYVDPDYEDSDYEDSDNVDSIPEAYVYQQVVGNYSKRGDIKPLYFEEVEGAKHDYSIKNLKALTRYTVTVTPINPWGKFESLIIEEETFRTTQEFCPNSSVQLPDAVKVVEVSATDITLNLVSWDTLHAPGCSATQYSAQVKLKEEEDWSTLELGGDGDSYKESCGVGRYLYYINKFMLHRS